jgi:hypothetical protein
MQFSVAPKAKGDRGSASSRRLQRHVEFVFAYHSSAVDGHDFVVDSQAGAQRNAAALHFADNQLIAALELHADLGAAAGVDPTIFTQFSPWFRPCVKPPFGVNARFRKSFSIDSVARLTVARCPIARILVFASTPVLISRFGGSASRSTANVAFGVGLSFGVGLHVRGTFDVRFRIGLRPALRRHLGVGIRFGGVLDIRFDVSRLLPIGFDLRLTFRVGRRTFLSLRRFVLGSGSIRRCRHGRRPVR